MESRADQELRTAAERWDVTSESRAKQPIQGWLDSAIVLESYVQPKIAGDPHKNWLQGLAENLPIPREGHWLSLGCGAAGQEIAASRWGLFRSMLAVDASPGSLQIARQSASDQSVTNIEFHNCDLNKVSLPAAAFDVVIMNMSLHHVRELREVLGGVHRALRRNGLFVINEFIGPRQFQFTDLQLGLVREFLEVLPARYRKDSTSGQLRTEYVRRSVDYWNNADPSEAIRSDRIVPEIERRFHVVNRIDYGGTILSLLLEHIVHNFDGANEEDVAWIRLLCRLEETFIRHSVIPSDFTVIVAEPVAPLERLARSLRYTVGVAVDAARSRLPRRT